MSLKARPQSRPCCVLGCESESSDGVSMHRIPKDWRRQAWLDAICMSEGDVKTYHRVCELHFLPQHFERNFKVKCSVRPPGKNVIFFRWQVLKKTAQCILLLLPNFLKSFNGRNYYLRVINYNRKNIKYAHDNCLSFQLLGHLIHGLAWMKFDRFMI